MKNVLLVHKITRNQGLAVEKECKRQTMRSAYTVSYTHLDVYKRQASYQGVGAEK